MKQTPEQVMRNGHIAAALRKWLKDNDKTVADINTIIGKTKTYSVGYQYISGKTAPNETNRKLLAAATGIAESELTPRNLPETKALPVGKLPETLSFTIVDNGQARIKFDIVLPANKAIALLQVIIKETAT